MNLINYDSQRLNCTRGIILRLRSKPTNKILTEKYDYKSSNIMSQKRVFSHTRFLGENSFVNTRPHMAPQSEPQSGK